MMLIMGSSGLDIDDVDVAAGNGKGTPPLAWVPIPGRIGFRCPEVEVRKGEERRGVGNRFVKDLWRDADGKVVVGNEIVK